MSQWIQCDSCDARIKGDAHGMSPIPPFAQPAAEQIRERDGWMHLSVSISREHKAPEPPTRGHVSGPLGEGEVFFEPQPVAAHLVSVQSHIDLCPACAKKFRDALGDAASAVNTEPADPPWVQRAPVIPLRIAPR